MAGNPKSALKGSAVPPSKDRARIRACSIALSSGSQHIGNLQWSELGQALVVTDDYIIILSPLTGLHPALAGQSRTQDVECHPDWNDRFPHSVAEINVKTFLENEHSVRRRTLLESDHSAVDPRFQSVQWSSACWSRPGMGSHTSCLILATTSELDLFVLGAPLNAWTGEWKLLHAVSLDPIADLTDLDATPSSGEKEVFSRSRALLRKKQMATEVTCASFVDLDGHTDVSDRPQPSSDYVIAGTRSGHIGVWNCAAVTGHCTFVSATSVSSTSIEKLVVSSQVGEEQTDLQARIAFKDADGVKLCGLHGANGHAEVRLLTASPINTERGMITAWRWVKDQLVYATISKINVFDSMTQQTTTFSVGTGPFDDLDPFSPVVEISLNSASSFELKAVLLDLREYSIPLLPPDEAQSEPEEVLPTLPSALTGYPPMTENLQREHNLYQAFLGYAVEPRSRLSTASMVGAVRTDEKVAFLGYNSSDTLCYQLEVLRKGSLVPSSLLDEALESAASGTPPYLAVRIIFALLYTSKQRKTLWTQFVSAIEERGLALAASSAGGSGQETTTAERRQRQLLYLLACRLEDSASKPSSSFDVLKRTYREAVLRDWIQTWVADLAQRQTAGQTSSQDHKTLLRLSAASRLLPDAGSEQTPQPLTTDEQCAACDTKLTLSWDEHRQDFGWAKCQKGHVWPRCSISLATISDREVVDLNKRAIFSFKGILYRSSVNSEPFVVLQQIIDDSVLPTQRSESDPIFSVALHLESRLDFIP